MTAALPQRITSRHNPLLQRIRKLAQDATAYRNAGQVWIEGEHLGSALHARSVALPLAVLGDSAWDIPALRALASTAAQVVVIADALFDTLSTMPSPARIGFVIDVPAGGVVDNAAPSVVLDRVQDPGNVGSILRSAAAFGFTQVLALHGTAALWSPKVLRAAMGAHFGLRLVEQLDADALQALQPPLLATSSHDGVALPAARLPWPCAWVLGHEGQGVAPSLLARCAQRLRIPQPGGEESLNVAAAAAVFLYESSRGQTTQGQ